MIGSIYIMISDNYWYDTRTQYTVFTIWYQITIDLSQGHNIGGKLNFITLFSSACSGK